MSHQSSLNVLSSLSSCNVLGGCSNAEIAQAADASFSLDAGQTPKPVPNPLDTNRNKSKQRFQLKKRKVSLETVSFDDDTSNFKADFLSGIFDDLSKAREKENETSCVTYGASPPLPQHSHSENSPRKKARIMPRTMTHCGRSLKNLADISAQGSQCGSNAMQPLTTHEVTPEEKLCDAANIIDQVFPSDLIFPKLPATVSQSSCSSNNLTQTSMQAAQVFENPTPIEGESKDKDSYGWFVEMDPDDTCNKQEYATLEMHEKSDLSFSAITAPKKDVQHEAEAQWAKAADTVDDVIGDCGFLDL